MDLTKQFDSSASGPIVEWRAKQLQDRVTSAINDMISVTGVDETKAFLQTQPLFSFTGLSTDARRTLIHSTNNWNLNDVLTPADSLATAPLSECISDLDGPSNRVLCTPDPENLNFPLAWGHARTESLPETSTSSTLSPITTYCDCHHCRKCVRRNIRPAGPSTDVTYLRPDLINILSRHWQQLKTKGLYSMSRNIGDTKDTMSANTSSINRLHHHLILRDLENDGDLYQWRRAIAELRNLENYLNFLNEISIARTRDGQVRQQGERNENKAHKDYITHIYSCLSQEPTEAERSKAHSRFKKDLQFGRRWSILVSGFEKDGGFVPGLGPGIVLASGPSIRRKIYNTGQTGNAELQAFVQSAKTSESSLVMICAILDSVARNLIKNHRISSEDDFHAVATELGARIPSAKK